MTFAVLSMRADCIELYSFCCRPDDESFLRDISSAWDHYCFGDSQDGIEDVAGLASFSKREGKLNAQ